VAISAIDCVQPAIQHARDQLFKPFRWGQWARLALVGILAAELHSGGCSFPTGNVPWPKQRSEGSELLSVPNFPHLDPSRLGQYLGLIGVILLLAAVLFIVFLYVNSVFRFILFDSVVQRRCSISEGWQRRRREGGRFFLWQLVFQFSFGLFFAVIVGVPFLIAAAAGWVRDIQQHPVRLIGSLILLFGLMLVVALVAAAAQVLAKDFLVPIMALEGLDFADGWSRLLAMIRPEPGKYAVYLLLKLALSILAAILFGIVAIIPTLLVVIPAVVLGLIGYAAGLGWSVTTISLAIIFGTMFLAILIYLIAFVSAPATIFFPAYAIYFFAPRYPNLAALLNPAPPAPEAQPVADSPPPEAPLLPPSPEPIG